MERYILQLIEELQDVAEKERQKSKAYMLINPDDTFDPAQIERYVYGDRSLLQDIVGISQEMLPQQEKLLDKQKECLAKELKCFLEAFRFYVDVPVGVPMHLLYHPIRELWMEEHVLMQTGESHIELCNYDFNNCPFPGYCTSCKDI